MILRLSAVLALAVLLFPGCAPLGSRPAENIAYAQAYQLRLEQLQPLEIWAIDARLAIGDGREGGSGNLSWVHDFSETRMSFRGLMGKGAWNLRASTSGAKLELANGSVYRAPSLDQLVLQQVGWRVPVDALSWWIKGLAHPGDWESRVLDADGRLQSLRQSGWEVNFSGYGEVEGVWLPVKITARRGDYSVKMVVRKWRLGEEVAGLESIES